MLTRETAASQGWVFAIVPRVQLPTEAILLACTSQAKAFGAQQERELGKTVVVAMI